MPDPHPAPPRVEPATPPADVPPSVLRADRVHDGERLGGPGWIALAEGRVTAVGAGDPPRTHGPVHELGDALLAPGCVDVHCHGGGGHAVESGPDAARAAAAAHARAGTTTVVASLVTDEVDALVAQLTALAPLRAEGVLAGVHLEGPWLSPLHRGAHRAASLRAPEPEDVARLVEAGAGSLAMVTLAPELPGALDAVGRLAEAGVLVAIGHTDASYEVTRAAIEAGARMATHLHNACRPAHHREPGPAVALLEDPRVGIETIVDGVHLHPATVRRVAREAGERWILVSDAMAAAGCGDGEFPLGPLRVRVHDGVARVVGADGAAGAIGGSTATVAGSVRSAVAAGVDLDAALRAATAAPADALGLPDVGRLRVGSRADAVVLGPELEVRGVLRHGTWVKAAAPAAAD